MRLALLAALPLLVSGSVFDTPELQIKPSPAQAVQIRLPDGLRVIDCDVSPAGPLVALLVSEPAGPRKIRLWNIGTGQPVTASMCRKASMPNRSHGIPSARCFSSPAPRGRIL
jgi:hypothetical protein